MVGSGVGFNRAPGSAAAKPDPGSLGGRERSRPRIDIDSGRERRLDPAADPGATRQIGALRQYRARSLPTLPSNRKI